MCRLIREHMAAVDGDFPLGGDGSKSPVVELDETLIGSLAHCTTSVQPGEM
jgi:hypothetical protein